MNYIFFMACYKQTDGGIQPTSNEKVKRVYKIIQTKLD